MVWRSFISHGSIVLVTWDWCLYGVFWEIILIGTRFKTFDGISILINGDVLPICTFQYEVFVMTCSIWLFSRTFYMRSSSSGSLVPSLKLLVGVVGVLWAFLLLVIYHLDRHKCCQEQLLPVGLHLKLQYLSTDRGHRVMAKLLWYGGTFSYFLLL